MSADNYLYVRQRPDGKFGISMRFASMYYRDEIDPRHPPLTEAGENVWAPIPEEWINDPPGDHYGIYDNPFAAISEAFTAEQAEYIVEYGVSLAPEVNEAMKIYLAGSAKIEERAEPEESTEITERL